MRLRQSPRQFRQSSVDRRPRRRLLELEGLEVRLAPVVGAFAPASLVPRGDLYDGVVRLNGCTGSLLFSGRHVLTAAHCAGADNTVRFHMIRDTTPVDIHVNVPMNIPADPAFQFIHPEYNGNPFRGNDIAVLRLTDQEPGFEASNRHLVPPFRAQRYNIQRTADEIGQVYSVVGYGQTGTGATGQTGGSGVKRSAWNHFTSNGTGWMSANPTRGLLSDFDDGTPAMNRLGDNVGMGVSEGMSASGDSGGPLFLGIGPTRPIAGVTSTGWDFPPAGWNGFNDVALDTRVSEFAGWIDSKVAGNYHLVLDMNQQVLGNDGLTENLTITARKVGANIELWVSGPSAPYSGLYYSAPAANVLSLTLRGSGDHETINLEAGLGVNVTVDGRGGNDTMNVHGVSAGTAMTINGGAGDDTINVHATTGTLTINGGAGNDRVHISPTAQNLNNILGVVNADGGTGNNVLTIRDRNYAFATIYTHDDVSFRGRLSKPGMASIIYAQFTGNGAEPGAAFYGSNVGATYNISYTQPFPMTLIAGNGNDIVNVNGTAGPLTVNAGDGNDQVHISRVGRNLNTIQGAVTAHAGTGSNTIAFYDQNSGFAGMYTLAGSLSTGSVHRLNTAGISYSGFNGDGDTLGATIHGSNGNTTFNVDGTHAWNTTLNSGDGHNIINVHAVSGALEIWAGAGNDQVHVSPTAQDLNHIQGNVVAYAGAGFNTIAVYDQNSAFAGTYTLGSVVIGGGTYNTVDRPGAFAQVQYHGFDGLGATHGATIHGSNGDTTFDILTTHQYATYLSTGSGNNWVKVQATTGILYVSGQGGADSLECQSAGDQDWSITSNDAGEVNGPALAGKVVFASMENLIGNAFDDSFRLADGQGVTGYIDGGLGVNTLDYAAYLTDVTVNLLLNTGTNVAGGVWSIQNATGGAGHDILVGDNASNVLRGNASRDVLIGGGDDGFSLNPDTLDGGAGEDILIAGFTFYDYSPADLDTLRLIWKGAATFEAGRNDLLNGLSGLVLNDTTAFSNWSSFGAAGTGNTLIGGADDDWFFSQPANLDAITDLTVFEDEKRIEIL